MKYIMLVCADESADITLDPAGIKAWLKETQERGIRLDGHRLQPVSDATSVRVRNGEVLVTDGPFAETREQIGGFDLLECANLDEAIEVAAKHPLAAHGTLEVRPFWDE